jgi:hypothetical protein
MCRASGMRRRRLAIKPTGAYRAPPVNEVSFVGRRRYGATARATIRIACVIDRENKIAQLPTIHAVIACTTSAK